MQSKENLRCARVVVVDEVRSVLDKVLLRGKGPLYIARTCVSSDTRAQTTLTSVRSSRLYIVSPRDTNRFGPNTTANAHANREQIVTEDDIFRRKFAKN